MSQKPQSHLQSTQPTAPNNTQAETQSSLTISFISQEPPPAIGTLRVSSPGPAPAASTHQLSPQEPPQTISILKVSSPEPPPILSTRRVSIQEPPPILSPRRVSIQEPPPILSPRRVSIQEPPPILSPRRVSIQEPLPILSPRRVSIQDPLPIFHSSRVNNQEYSPDISSHRACIQDTPSITYNHWVGAQDGLPAFQNKHSGPLTEVQSVAHASQTSIENLQERESLCQTFKQRRYSVDVPPSITRSPEASIKSVESIVWSSQESCKEGVHSAQTSQTTLESHSIGGSNRFQKCSHQSLLPIGWLLLHEARKISRKLSLVLTLAGMVIIGLISLGQPWMHFQVPLTPPGDPAGSLTIPIKTIFFSRCPDVSCLHEYDKNAYLLDFSWAFLVVSSIISFCLCVVLISTIFFTSSNLPMLDFFLFISSIMTGTSLILSILFYLMQAQKFLQEGMTYRLAISFYLAWTAVFFFLMNGFFSYLNYVNFWSILAIQAVWT